MKTKNSNHKPMHDQIAQRAYAIFEQSGRAPGRDLQNWLRAESELNTGSSQDPEGKEPKNNDRATTSQAMASTRRDSRMERKYA